MSNSSISFLQDLYTKPKKRSIAGKELFYGENVDANDDIGIASHAINHLNTTTIIKIRTQPTRQIAYSAWCTLNPYAIQGVDRNYGDEPPSYLTTNISIVS
jgi:hypothetical protein